MQLAKQEYLAKFQTFFEDLGFLNTRSHLKCEILVPVNVRVIQNIKLIYIELFSIQRRCYG